MTRVPNCIRWILRVHTSPGRLQPWGRMCLMRRHFLRRGIQKIWNLMMLYTLLF
nr:hypothetical protein Iba_scaffold137CG0160 [Ipomoea batatas]